MVAGPKEPTLSDIAYACVFSSQAHMTTSLRKALGTTPGEYRTQVND
ncbi:MAG: AraC family transcriptional regulator [Pseudomonadota bacterium]